MEPEDINAPIRLEAVRVEEQNPQRNTIRMLVTVNCVRVVGGKYSTLFILCDLDFGV